MAPTLTTNPPTLQLIPEPLTPESFAPFGTAIYSPLPRNLTSAPPLLSSLPPHTPAPEPANQGSALKYSPISPLLDNYNGSCPSGKPSSARMSMFSCFPRKLRPATTTTTTTTTTTSTKDKEGKGFVFDVRILERHPFTTQTFIPIDLSSARYAGWAEEPVFLVIVAPTQKSVAVAAATAVDSEGGNKTTTEIRDPPDLENLRAFVARGGMAVTYAAGTWHAPMVVVGRRRVDFVVVQFANGVEQEDCQEVAFGEGITVKVGDLDLGRRVEGEGLAKL